MPQVVYPLDSTKSFTDQQYVGHNRWHPEVPANVTVKPGDVFRVDCREWFDGAIVNDDSADDILNAPLTTVHVLSGPFAVEGAEPGDLLIVDIVDVGPIPQEDSGPLAGQGWGYTGGNNPYGYRAMGELSVFLFFGLVATAGSTYVQTRDVAPLALVLGSSIGLIASALLVVNNLRDRAADERMGKRTLAVRLGDRRTRLLYNGSLAGAGLLVIVAALRWGWPILLGLVVGPLGFQAIRKVGGGASGPELIEVLGITGRILLGGGIALAIGVALAVS